MAKFHQIPTDSKIEILRNAGEKMNLPAFAIEKDWWVVQTLAILFETVVGQHMVFKGGTSLSKAWGLVNRQLYTEIVLHRYSYTKLGGVNYKLHNPATIKPIPPAELLDSWASDYQTMQEQMIYTNSPEFGEMLDLIQTYILKLNQLDWQIF
jgi:hypothetical protein